MTERRAGRLAVGIYVLTLAFAALSLVLLVLSWDVDQLADAWGPRGFSAMLGISSGTVGYVILRRQPTHAIGWCFSAAGVIGSLQGAGDEWAIYTLLGSGTGPGGEWGAWLVNWAWIVAVALLMCFVVVLFPDGRFASAGARRFALVITPLLTLSLFVQMFADYELQGFDVPNPAGFLPVGQETAETLLFPMILAIVGAQVSFIRRLRRTTGEAREQMRWFVVGEAAAGFSIALSGVLLFDPPQWVADTIELLGAAGVMALIGSAAVAILKYRLYDVDVVISRSLMFLGMTGFVTLAYVGIVAGIGAFVQRSDEPNHLLAVSASVVVAVAFQPVRQRLHRFADRVAYGTRAEPYEVLASLADQMRASEDPESTLATLARSLNDGTGASTTTIWLRVVDELRPAATYPLSVERPSAVAVADGLAALPGDRVEAVEHDGELLGAISLTKRYADALPPAEHRLVRDIAAHAGLLLRNLRLTAELQRHIEELRDSRQRLVSAQDTERRRIERNLHDGAQQQLVALKVQLGLARHIAQDEGATRTDEVIQTLSDELGEALATLRELAHGIYPPRLAADGLMAALGTQAAKAAVPCEVVGEVGRYGADVEAAAYFCCLEALQNVGKYAEASCVRIELASDGGTLRFTIVDDGRGFDVSAAAAGIGLTNMRDRVEALDGTLEIASVPGGGTRVQGRIPVPATAGEPPASVDAHV